MSDPVIPFTRDQLIALANSGVEKIDLWGQRGATMVSLQEIEAMAVMLTLCQLRDLPDDTPQQLN